MRWADMGVIYLGVLGLEAVLAYGLSILALHENFSWQRLGAICIILFGVFLLQRL